jgi:hypothetical protein
VYQDSLKNQDRDIMNKLNTHRIKEVKENRNYLSVIIRAIIFLARQEIALRANDESVKSLNKGNFKELLNLIEEESPAFKETRSKLSKKCQYNSAETQNELLSIIASQIQSRIVEEAKSNKYFSILADETSDITNVEQLSIVIRYVTNDLNDGPKIRERFLGFIPLERTNSETIFLALTNKLKSLGLSFENVTNRNILFLKY